MLCDMQPYSPGNVFWTHRHMSRSQPGLFGPEIGPARIIFGANPCYMTLPIFEETPL